VAGGASEYGKVTYECSEQEHGCRLFPGDRGATFSTTKNIYKKQSINMMMPDMQCKQI
jgi:hypothetical protein